MEWHCVGTNSALRSARGADPTAILRPQLCDITKYFVYSREKSSHIRLAQYLDGCVALKQAHEYFPHWNWEVKKQVVDAYPIVALMANLDAFHNDNVLVDRKGKVWFVDNAAGSGDARRAGDCPLCA